MFCRYIVPILLLTAAVHGTSQSTDWSKEKSVIKDQQSGQHTKSSTGTKNICIPAIKKTQEREIKLTQFKEVPDAATFLIARSSSHDRSTPEIKIDSRFGDEDVDSTQLENYRITNKEDTDDYDSFDDKSSNKYGNSYQQRPKNTRATTRPSIIYQQSTTRHATTRKPTSVRANKNRPSNNAYNIGSSTNNNQNGKRKGSTSYFYSQTTKRYETSTVENVRPGTSFSGSPKPVKTYPSTTQNPFLNRPGVKPATVNVDRPFTNRPITKRPGTMPTDADAITFPDDSDGRTPELTSGRDEAAMSYDEIRRYEELAERMCEKYKSTETKQLEAIPLLPSPEPVRVNISDCTPRTVPLIVGGKVVSIKDFPHMALLGWPKLQDGGYSWKCGGSLISDRFILTAAHCSNQERDNSVVTGPPRAAQLGSTYLDDPGALVVKVSSVIRHPKYKPPKSYYDIALVKLTTPVKFSERIKPACLGRPPSPGDSVVATGWGRTEFGEQSEELRSVSLPIWDIEDCWTTLGTSKKLPNGPEGENQICAGERKGGKDTCQGDSGGPAQVRDGCVWRVVAVTSVGRGCGASHTPGIYAIANTAFIAANAFANQNGRDKYDQTTNYNKLPKVNYMTESYNRGGNGNYNSGANRVNNNFVTEYPQDPYSHNNQRRSNGYEVYENDFGYNPSWTSFNRRY